RSVRAAHAASEPRTQRSGVSGGWPPAYSAALRARLGRSTDKKSRFFFRSVLIRARRPRTKSVGHLFSFLFADGAAFAMVEPTLPPPPPGRSAHERSTAPVPARLRPSRR